MNDRKGIRYADLVDVPKLQELMENFSATIGIANAVIDVDGVVITSAGWQDVCTGFHRVNSLSCARCVASDTSLVKSMTQGETYAIYRCLNGLVDTAAPIVVNGEHVANVFTGQFFTDPPDHDFFVAQARQFGFDETSYLAAVGRVPILAQDRAESVTRLYAQLAALLANNGLDRLKQIRATDELARLNKALEQEVAARTEELTRANEELRARELLLRQILDTSSVAIFLIANDGRITHANQRTAEMFGTTSAVLIGGEYLAYVHPDERDTARQTMRMAIAGAKASIDVERRYCRQDGGEFWGHLTGRRFFDAVTGEDHGLISVIADITERKEAERQLQHFNAELEKRVQERTAELEGANRDLESFSYSVSHDLRSPLRAINGFARILATEEGERLSLDGRDMLERIARAATKLGDLIDDVLEYSRAGRLTLTEEDVDLGLLARKVASDLHEAYPQTEIVVRDLPKVRGDPTMLRQILANLLGNACKYSSKRDRPLVEIGVRDDPTETVIHVRDNGAGFDMEYAGKLFGMFQRLHPEREFNGTGVGLAIVKRLVERHGGRVWAEAVVNAGASFYFTLHRRSA